MCAVRFTAAQIMSPFYRTLRYGILVTASAGAPACRIVQDGRLGIKPQ